MSTGGRTVSRAATSPTGILTQPLNAPEESPPDGSLVHGGRPVPAGHHPDGQAHVHARQGRRTGPAEDQGTAGCRHAERRRGEANSRRDAAQAGLSADGAEPIAPHPGGASTQQRATSVRTAGGNPTVARPGTPEPPGRLPF